MIIFKSSYSSISNDLCLGISTNPILPDNLFLNFNSFSFDVIKKQAQDLQKITIFWYDATLEAQSFLAQLWLNVDAILRLTPLIQDYATAQGIQLTDAAKLVAKSFGSSTNALSRYGLQIEGTVGEQDRL